MVLAFRFTCAQSASLAWRSASDVTAQVLNIVVLLRPADFAWLRITSDSNAFSLQPNVMTSGEIFFSVIMARFHYSLSQSAPS